MQDREKLIELLGGDMCNGCYCEDCEHENNEKACIEHIKRKMADHLIANGVTVRESGRWIPHYETFDADAAVGILGGNYQTGWQCSVCGRYEPGKEPYCNCGADMRGEEDG